MDDKKYFTVQVKGEAYRFRPLDMDAIQRLGVVQAMDPSTSVILKALFAPMKTAAVEPEAWDALTTRFVKGEVAVDDMTKLLDKLVNRTVEHNKATSGEGK